MRFTTVVLSAIMAAVSVQAQNATQVTAPAVSHSVSLSPAQSSQASCLASCASTDPSCRAKCVVVPEGDYSQQNRTIECIADCPKGNGTATDNLNFENCQKDCLVSATMTSATAAPTATGGSTGSGPVTGDAKPSGTNGAGVSATGSSPSATSSKSAAGNVQLGVSVVGVVGLFAALFAL